MVRAALIALLLLGAVEAIAHTTIESATPQSGAVLQQSPPAIDIRFKDAVRLTSVVVVTADNGERKLSFSPTANSQQFSIATPALADGRNEIRWKALSKDGHVLSGSLIYVVESRVDQASQ